MTDPEWYDYAGRLFTLYALFMLWLTIWFDRDDW